MALGFAFFAGADAIAILFALSGVSFERYVPTPWPWTSTASLLCLVLALICAVAAAIQLSVFRMRDLEHEIVVRRLDVLKENIDQTLTGLHADTRN